jgi:lipopolysaccharide export system protein LptC
VTVAAIPQGAFQQEFRRWRRRSRFIRQLRFLLPAAIGLILAILAGFVIRTTIVGVQAEVAEADTPIQLINPRFVGRDDKGRAYVLTAASAIRDENDYQRVLLDKPSLILDEEGENPATITAKSGVYREDRRMLNLEGGVKMVSGALNFDTASSIFNTATGELEGQGQISGAGSLGEITAKSYGVYDKGDRLVFKGGVRGRIDSK